MLSSLDNYTMFMHPFVKDPTSLGLIESSIF